MEYKDDSLHIKWYIGWSITISYFSKFNSKGVHKNLHSPDHFYNTYNYLFNIVWKS